MLFAVRNSVLLLILVLSLTAGVATRSQQAPPAGSPAQTGSPGQLAPQAPPNSSPAPQRTLPPQPTYAGPTVVIDPAHGGTDTGARGQNGVIEKDIVLQFARVARSELVKQGYRVILTREDDSNPSYDDRASVANSNRDAIFISLHISSTGPAGTARAYYDEFPAPLSSPSPSGASGDQTSAPSVSVSAPPATSLVAWNEAQRAYGAVSQRLADQLQSQLVSSFSGSPQASIACALRGLRSVAAPAVDIEISSVSVPDAKSLTVLAGPLADSIAKALQAFRPAAAAGAK